MRRNFHFPLFLFFNLIELRVGFPALPFPRGFLSRSPPIGLLGTTQRPVDPFLIPLCFV